MAEDTSIDAQRLLEFSVGLGVLTLVATYIVSTTGGRVAPFIPIISEMPFAGPESSFYGPGLAISIFSFILLAQVFHRIFTPLARELGGNYESWNDEARAFCAFYGVTPQGNWEGQSVLQTPLPLEEVVQTLGLERAEMEELLATSRGKLLAARRERESPGCDDKLLTAWNGLAISAFAEGYSIFQDDQYLKAASKAATFLQNNLVDSTGRLLRSWRDGRAGPTAFLDDYACLAEGMLTLYEASGTPWHLEWALALGEEMLALFGAGDGSLWASGSDQESLYFRHREPLDGATPSPTGA